MDAPTIRRVAAQWPGGTTPVSRFAPSPTGDLHLGHVAHALWLWGVSAALEGRIVCRMEDQDRTRSSTAYERGILADLDWFGFPTVDPSRASLEAAGPSPWRQSDHFDRYAVALERLAGITGVYGCTCTRAMLAPAKSGGERRYPGTCRGAPLDRAGRHVWRLELPPEVVHTEDLRLGTLTHDPSHEHGDVVVRDALGQWTYQLAVVVDDLHDGVTLAVRGEDLLAATGRQQLMRAMLDPAAPPLRTLHHPLLYAPDGSKLSKRDASESVARMRGAGMTAVEVVERAWGLAGLD